MPCRACRADSRKVPAALPDRSTVPGDPTPAEIAERKTAFTGGARDEITPRAYEPAIREIVVGDVQRRQPPLD